jgi:CheY-like chemotaxis protein
MAANVKVLLVDDNPMILKILEQALAPVAELVLAHDGAEALMTAIDQPPDLVVCDYQMKGMDGRQLMETLKSRPATARVPVVLLASKTDITEKLKMLQDRVEDFLEKPFFIKEATVRLKRIIDRIALEKLAREAAGGSIVRGSLTQMNVIDLLQSLEMGQKTCKLTLLSGVERCEVFLNEGQINDAIGAGLRGDEAVYKVLTWQGGTFEIDFASSSSEQSVTRSTQGLLMEGLRLLDESNRDSEENNVVGG